MRVESKFANFAFSQAGTNKKGHQRIQKFVDSIQTKEHFSNFNQVKLITFLPPNDDRKKSLVPINLRK